MKKWDLLDKSKLPIGKANIDKVIKILLKNRNLNTKKEVKDFLNPKLSDVTIKNVGIDQANLNKSIKRINTAIKNKEQIIVFGDYDVDGICGAAILWETLNSKGAKVLPYIPNRVDEGYGLSVKGIENLKSKIPNVSLIITVDNGIVANNAVDFANENKIDVIITDHHVPSKTLPKAFSIVHSTKLCGAGVAYLLSEEFRQKSKNDEENHLELVALATVADLVPLKAENRVLLKLGLEKLKVTKRLGLLELFKNSGIDKNLINVYEIGHVIAPRLNAMGRLESAMDSLRLICTTSRQRAQELAYKLGSTNTKRRTVTEEAVLHAMSSLKVGKINAKLIFISNESYQQGVIGLIAGKLVEEYYLPSIVVSKGEIYSKASARSISGFNIIEFIRGASELLVDAGGHPMAAGFTIETSKIELVKKKFEDLALAQVTKEMLTRSLKIDCELPASYITPEFYEEILQLEPFGMGNPIPVFVTRDLVIEDMRTVGQEGKHLKLEFRVKNSELKLHGIAFGIGNKISEFKIGQKVQAAYTIDENLWNGNKNLQLKIRDIKN